MPQMTEEGPLPEPRNRADLYPLNPFEVWWRDHFNVLLENGYRLRPRYHPDWKPSWLDESVNPLLAEDSITNVLSKTIDATRVSDGRVVYLKKITKNSTERTIAEYLTTVDRLQNPKNHCVPILGHFDLERDDKDNEIEIIVMPLLRPLDEPPFRSVDEVIDFVRQTLEGLTFIHSQNVAHRDCTYMNIMMDASVMFPKGFHPIQIDFLPSGFGFAPYRRRSRVSNLKYYFIDFGISTHFQEGESHEVVGRKCGEREVPELSSSVPYNPFATDIFILGCLYKQELLQKHTNLTFLKPLVNSMTKIDPDDRPSSDEALKLFNQILSRQRSYTLQWFLKDEDTGKFERVFLDIISTGRYGASFVRKLIRSPFTR